MRITNMNSSTSAEVEWRLDGRMRPYHQGWNRGSNQAELIGRIMLYVLLCRAILCIPFAEATPVSSAAQLRSAVESLRPVITIVAQGTYLMDSPLQVNSKMLIRAPVPNTVFLNGQNQTRLFELQLHADLTLANLTIEDGLGDAPPSYTSQFPATPQGGGCIAAYTLSTSALYVSTSLTLISTTFRYCVSQMGNGGAIMLYLPSSSAFSCMDCIFENNQALNGSGGAVYFSVYDASFGKRMLFNGGLFFNNQAKVGGAVFVNDASAEKRFTDVALWDNYATDYGGALATSEDVELVSTDFTNNSAGFNEANAVELTNGNCVLSIDTNTSSAFTGNGGVDGYVGKFPLVIHALHPFSQVRVVTFTSAPTPSNTLPPVTPPTRPPFQPTIPPSFDQSPSGSTDLIAETTSTILGAIVLLSLVAVFINHRRRTAERNNNMTAEEEHNAFAHRRNFRPKVVAFKEFLPGDFVTEPCTICGEQQADDTTIAKSLGTISATKAQLNSVLAMGTTFGRVECDHAFHVACIIVWCEVNGKTTCPTCRQVIATDVKRRQSSQTSSSDGPSNNQPGRRSTGAGSGGAEGGLRQTMSAPSMSAAAVNNNNPVAGTGSPAGNVKPEDLVITVPTDMPFRHVARRSTNTDDLEAENAVLMREMNQAVARLEDVRQQSRPSRTGGSTLRSSLTG